MIFDRCSFYPEHLFFFIGIIKSLAEDRIRRGDYYKGVFVDDFYALGDFYDLVWSCGAHQDALAFARVRARAVEDRHSPAELLDYLAADSFITVRDYKNQFAVTARGSVGHGVDDPDADENRDTGEKRAFDVAVDDRRCGEDDRVRDEHKPARRDVRKAFVEADGDYIRAAR